MARSDDLVVGLDIGTTKICVIVADRTENGIDIVGIGTHPSRGVRRGVVVDIDATVNSIKGAVEEAGAPKEIAERCEGKGFELSEVASGFRFQVRQELSPWVARLWSERPTKYSRAMLETLALIAYRQPITRGDRGCLRQT